MQTVTYKVKGCIPSCITNAKELQVGEEVYIYLDQAKVPSFPERIKAATTLVEIGSAALGYDRMYSFEYDEADLGGAVTSIEQCDIAAVPRCISCCDALDERVTALEDAPESTAKTYTLGIDTGNHLLTLDSSDPSEALQSVLLGGITGYTFSLSGSSLVAQPVDTSLSAQTVDLSFLPVASHTHTINEPIEPLYLLLARNATDPLVSTWRNSVFTDLQTVLQTSGDTGYVPIGGEFSPVGAGNQFAASTTFMTRLWGEITDTSADTTPVELEIIVQKTTSGTPAAVSNGTLLLSSLRTGLFSENGVFADPQGAVNDKYQFFARKRNAGTYTSVGAEAFSVSVSPFNSGNYLHTTNAS